VRLLQRPNFGGIDAAQSFLNNGFIPGIALPKHDWNWSAGQPGALAIAVVTDPGPSRMPIHRSGFPALAKYARAKKFVHAGSMPQPMASSSDYMGLESHRSNRLAGGPKSHCRSNSTDAGCNSEIADRRTKQRIEILSCVELRRFSRTISGCQPKA
jgi:hypothetical protein